jgi:hypothetical protein
MYNQISFAPHKYPEQFSKLSPDWFTILNFVTIITKNKNKNLFFKVTVTKHVKKSNNVNGSG